MKPNIFVNICSQAEWRTRRRRLAGKLSSVLLPEPQWLRGLGGEYSDCFVIGQCQRLFCITFSSFLAGRYLLLLILSMYSGPVKRVTVKKSFILRIAFLICLVG